LFAEINEYVSDVYFANGIDTTKEQAYLSKDKFDEKFKLFNLEAYNSVNDWQISYNHTHGIGIDLSLVPQLQLWNFIGLEITK